MVEGDYERAYRAHIGRWGVGATLRGAREAGGETIPEAARATRIRAEYLYALENEDFHSLPGWAYALSYVRTYADYLGLEPLPLVKKVRDQFELRQHTGTVPQRGERRGRRWSIAAGLMIALGVAVAGGWYFTSPVDSLASVFEPVPRKLKALINETFFTVADSGPTEPAADNRDEIMTLLAAEASQAAAPRPAPAFAEPGPGVDTAPIASTSAARFAPLRDPEPPSDKVLIGTYPRGTIDRVAEPPIEDIVLRARASVRLSIRDATGRSLLDQQVAEGAVYRLPTGAGITVSVDNAGAIEVYVAGALAGLIGPAGTPVSRLPVDSLTGPIADG